MSGPRRNTLIPFRVQSRLSLSTFGDSPPTGGFPFLPNRQHSTAHCFLPLASRAGSAPGSSASLPPTPDGSGVPGWPQQPAALIQAFPTPRAAVASILDTFPIVKRKDEKKWGDYRIKRVILEIYDALTESIQTGQPYQTRFDPPPADARCCHPPKSI